jgi:outer membrane lipoprotein SlyB
MKKFLMLITLVIPAFILTGCYSDYGSDEYSGATAGQAQNVRFGTIAATNPVTIEDQSNQGIGMLAGAAAGAILGSRLGTGSTANALGGIGGGLAGGAAGSAAGKAIGKQNGMQYIVKLDDGSALSIVQAPQPALSVGQRVMVLTGSDGRDRVLADNTANTTTTNK